MRTPRSPADEAHSGSAAERSLRLLSTLAHEGRPLSLADLVQALGLPKATVHRQLTQLLESNT